METILKKLGDYGRDYRAQLCHGQLLLQNMGTCPDEGDDLGERFSTRATAAHWEHDTIPSVSSLVASSRSRPEILLNSAQYVDRSYMTSDWAPPEE